jgi:LPXTG-motif cell wall-anchored protein
MKLIAPVTMALMITLLGTLPGYALASWFPPGDGGGGTSRSAPGPVIGIGFPALAALGGYVWYRRRQRGK